VRLRRLRADWEHLGATDPFWAVLSDPAKRGGRWDEADFYRSGRDEVATVMAYVDRVVPGLPRGRALDFGCGPGRNTLALADHFDEAVGVDVSRPMIDLACARAASTAVGNCEFAVNDRADLTQFADGSFDLVYSRLVIQHLPRWLARSYLRDIVRVLSPAGVAVVQIPTKRINTRLPTWAEAFRQAVVYQLRARRADEARVRVFGVARHVVEREIVTSGGRVLHVAPDASVGSAWESWLYVFTTAAAEIRPVALTAAEWRTP
jgi:ubiquinone/menaquinone biosynthesis C-methylase UbiE